MGAAASAEIHLRDCWPPDPERFDDGRGSFLSHCSPARFSHLGISLRRRVHADLLAEPLLPRTAGHFPDDLDACRPPLQRGRMVEKSYEWQQCGQNYFILANYHSPRAVTDCVFLCRRRETHERLVARCGAGALVFARTACRRSLRAIHECSSV